MAKVVAEYGEGPHDDPAVGMQLGGGHIDFSQESVLEPRERKAKLEPLEDNCVHKKEGFFRACAVVNTHGLTLFARQNLHVYVELPPEYLELLISLALLVRINVLKSVYLRSFGHKAIEGQTIERFVIDEGWKVRGGFCSSHLNEGI